MSKVLITTGIFPPDIGGPATYVPKFASHLTNLGEKVEVITLHSGDLPSETNYRFPVIRLDRSIKRSLRMLLTVREIVRHLKNCDLLFCNGLIIETAIAKRIAKFNGKSVVKIVGDPVWERMRNREQLEQSRYPKIDESFWKIMSKVERIMLIWSLGQFGHITCPGGPLAETITSWNKKLQVKVIANGVVVANNECSLEKRFDLISISRLVPWKNLDQLIQIATDLDCSLAIIGDGPCLADLKGLAKGSEKIVFLGRQDPDQIEKLLCESKIFCQISDYEGLSFSLLQAMVHQLPCVISDIPSNREVFKTNSTAAIFYTPLNRGLVLQEIKELLSSEDKRTHMGTEARAIVEHYFDENKKLQEMYELLNANA